ncbi:MAG: hypothetical protein BGP12_16725 [Rhodospirillales bacterium 70-18]|nr:hypothetical protein [Rhodospirillales bacterium]OJY64169.1 MAG: hypothetical protein BGP12_16725 [Rhodospirillales bacterium 70-18]
MTMALAEEVCSVDTDLIYPNIQTCMALVLGSTGGTLAGMHMTMYSSAAQIQRAATALMPFMLGPIDSIVCIGNVGAWAPGAGRDAAMVMPGQLRQTLRTAFNYHGNVLYFDTAALFGQAGPGLNNGVVVHAWRDAGNNQIRYAYGPHGALQANGHGLAAVPVFFIGAMATANYVGQNLAEYTLGGGMFNLPVMGMATM